MTSAARSSILSTDIGSTGIGLTRGEAMRFLFVTIISYFSIGSMGALNKLHLSIPGSTSSEKQR